MYPNDVELFASMESKEVNLEPGKTEIMLFGTAKRLNTIVEKIEVSYSQQKFSFMKSTSILET